MRFTLSFVLCLAGLMLFSQRYQPAHWMTTDGVLDSGFVKIPRRTLHSINDITYKTNRRAKSEDPYALSWLVSNNDTLFLEKEMNGYYEMLQLLSGGEVNLYRSIRHPEFVDFFLQSDQFFQEFASFDGVDNFVVFAEDDCAVFKRQQVKAKENSLVRSINAINKCRGSDGRPKQTWQRDQWWFNLGLRIDEDLFERRPRQPYPFFLASESRWYVGVERYWPAVPGLSTQMRLRLLRGESEYVYQGGIFASTETADFQINESYRGIPLSLGGRYQILPRYSISPYLAGGLIAVIPLHYLRTVENMTDFGLSNVPDKQRVQGGIRPNIGYYYQAGVRFAINYCMDIDIGLRVQDYVQYRDLEKFPPTIPAGFFSRNAVLIEQRELELNLSLFYRWFR